MKLPPCKCQRLAFPHKRNDACDALEEAEAGDRERANEIHDQQAREWAAERGAIAREFRR